MLGAMCGCQTAGRRILPGALYVSATIVNAVSTEFGSAAAVSFAPHVRIYCQRVWPTASSTGIWRGYPRTSSSTRRTQNTSSGDRAGQQLAGWRHLLSGSFEMSPRMFVP